MGQAERAGQKSKTGLRRTAWLKSGAINPVPRVPASEDQRLKVASIGCVVCGRAPADPAHLVPRRLGGCDHRDCVIALCRPHHRLFDTGRLALAPYLGSGLRRERGHALCHAGAAELREALEGGGWPAPWELEDEKGGT